MRTVQPIRDSGQIEGMKKILKSQNYRNYMIFIFGINSGMRISDILKLRVKDIATEKHKPKFRFVTTEKKTGKEKIFRFNGAIQNVIIEFFKHKENRQALDAYVFTGRYRNAPISRQHYYEVIKEAARQVGIQDDIGCHTMRKTFGYHAYRRGIDVLLLQEIFNHSAPSVTKRYIGITQDEIDNVYMEMEL